MGTAFLWNKNGNIVKLPVLDDSYPADVSVIAGNGSATFKVVIAEAGAPADYTYQWYVNGTAISDATGVTYTMTELSTIETKTVYCVVTNKAGAVNSRVATLTVKPYYPEYTYTGSTQLIEDGDYNWRIKFLTSGTLEFTSLGNCSAIDVFLVGGGAGGSCGGGGGGYTKTQSSVAVSNGNTFSVVVGAGGANRNSVYVQGGTGGTTSFGSYSVSGGTANAAGDGNSGCYGGNGGSGGGGGLKSSAAGGSDGGNGKAGTGYDNSTHYGGTGQGTTTREFGESSGTLYSGGGGACGIYGSYGAGGDGGGGHGCSWGGTVVNGEAGGTNTGGGGGGSWSSATSGAGGSGIVVIRNAR